VEIVTHADMAASSNALASMVEDNRRCVAWHGEIETFKGDN
jgi:hypothetical protein